MNEQPDNLFRRKLASHSRQPSAQAWERIENNLQPKMNKFIWLSIAAAILLLVIGTALLLTYQTGNGKSEVIAEVEPSRKTKDSTQLDAALKRKRLEPSNEINNSKKEKAAPKTTQSQKEKQITKPKTTETIDGNEYKVPHRDFAVAEQEVINSVAVVDQINDSTGVLVAETPTPTIDETSNVIVYSPEEVDDKFLDKKSLAEATSAEKKSSGLKRVLDKAFDLKHNQDPIGQLRQKKDEILALNFKSDKRRENR